LLFSKAAVAVNPPKEGRSMRTIAINVREAEQLLESNEMIHRQLTDACVQAAQSIAYDAINNENVKPEYREEVLECALYEVANLLEQVQMSDPSEFRELIYRAKQKARNLDHKSG
jgi:hypothetical protein